MSTGDVGIERIDQCTAQTFANAGAVDLMWSSIQGISQWRSLYARDVEAGDVEAREVDLSK